MRLTLLVVASDTGLGYQTRDYYKHLNPHRTVIIDISNLNGMPQHYDWYEEAHVIKGIPTDDQVRNIICADTDVIMTAETPYNLNTYAIARHLGIKTVCVENPEFYDHIKYPEFELPDLIILPSVWMEEEIRTHAESKGTKVLQIHHPVDREDMPFRLRNSKKPIHIAGKPAANDRNGTWDFLRACPNGTVTTQNHDLGVHIRRRYREARVLEGIDSRQEIYQMGDILVLPRKYGGNCLPLNEALSSGMPVIMPDISPNDHLLPKEWLVPATLTGSFTPRTRIDIYTVDWGALRDKIEWMRSQDMAVLSKQASEIADSISWATLKPQYVQALEGLCD